MVSNFKFSQLDIVEPAVDPESLSLEEWITTTPLTDLVDTTNPEDMGLAPANSTPDEAYAIASKISETRNLIQNPTDGVYCPICHKVNKDLSKLGLPCPTCNRNLLRFGWE